MNTLTCPNCRAAIPPDAPGGICPSCALLGAAQPTVVMPVSSAASRDEVAAAFPDLEILHMIGQGGMGVVFQARQPRLDRLVALKILPPHLAAQPGFSERFTREARALARLNHPNIVTVFDFGESGGFFYLLMEYVEGVNLRKAMQAGMKPEQAMLLVPHVCEALQFAHDHGVLHRDIKPENILLDKKGIPKLADFGIAKLAGEAFTGLTLSGAALGTAAYMAPEQIEKPATVDHRADIYSLGVVLYEMLTGELPLGRFAAPSEKAAVGEGVDAVVLRALEKERDRRQQSAGEMKTQVEGAHLNGPAVPLLPVQSGEGPPESRMKHLLGTLTALCGIGIPASAVVPAFHKIGLTPPAMVFLCAAFGVLAAAWPGKRSRRWRTAGPREASPTASFESRSRRWLFGMPLWHVVRGINPATGVAPVARGIIAIGPVARGWIALGGRANGVIALGGIATGVITLGGISLGLISAGGLAVGLLCAVGGLSVGSLVMGGMMVGLAPLVVTPSGAPLGGQILFGPMAEASRELIANLHRSAAIAGITIGACVFIVLMCAIFSATPPMQPVAAGPATHSGSRRSSGGGLVVAILFVIVAAIVFKKGSWSYQSGTERNMPSDEAYEELPVRDTITSKRPPFAAVWDYGSAELVGISYYPSTKGPWWGMDGKFGAEGPFVWLGGAGVSGPHTCEFVFHLRDLPAGASKLEWQVENAVSTAGGAAPALVKSPTAPLEGYVSIAAAFRKSQETANIKLGVAGGEWRTISVGPNLLPMLPKAVRHEDREWTIKHDKTLRGGGGVSFAFSLQKGWQARLVAVDLSGKDFAYAEQKSQTEATLDFKNVKQADVKETRFEVRPYQWIEFRDIALKPAQP